LYDYDFAVCLWPINLCDELQKKRRLNNGLVSGTIQTLQYIKVLFPYGQMALEWKEKSPRNWIIICIKINVIRFNFFIAFQSLLWPQLLWVCPLNDGSMGNLRFSGIFHEIYKDFSRFHWIFWRLFNFISWDIVFLLIMIYMP
jgi:hypothetical protein